MKSLFQVMFAIFVFLFCQKPVFAKESLVVVDKEGKVSIKVLSAEDSISLVDDEDIRVRRIASQGADSDSNIRISKNGDRINMKVGMDKNFDATTWKDDLVEVEARENTKLVKIAHNDGNFLISEENVVASTDLPIIIDPLNGKFMVETLNGRKDLGILPLEAARSILKTKIISKVNDKPFQITSDETGLSYLISGEKIINILSFYDLKLPISAKISAETGEVRGIVEPSWLKFLSVIFV